jgi:hypothetical protein
LIAPPTASLLAGHGKRNPPETSWSFSTLYDLTYKDSPSLMTETRADNSASLS